MKVEIDISWYQIQLLKEIEEKHYDSHKIFTLIKKISERNIDIICRLQDFFKKHGVEENEIKTFLEKTW